MAVIIILGNLIVAYTIIQVLLFLNRITPYTLESDSVKVQLCGELSCVLCDGCRAGRDQP